MAKVLLVLSILVYVYHKYLIAYTAEVLLVLDILVLAILVCI